MTKATHDPSTGERAVALETQAAGPACPRSDPGLTFSDTGGRPLKAKYEEGSISGSASGEIAPRTDAPGRPRIGRYDARRATGTVTIPPSFFPDGEDPEAYALIAKGRCMEPLVPDGSMLICSPARQITAGALVAVWPDKAPPFFKRLVHAPLFSLATSKNPHSTVVECIEFEMLNPPSRLEMPADRIDRMHVLVGTMPPGSFEQRRKPMRDVKERGAA